MWFRGDVSQMADVLLMFYFLDLTKTYPTVEREISRCYLSRHAELDLVSLVEEPVPS